MDADELLPAHQACASVLAAAGFVLGPDDLADCPAQ